MLFVCGFLRFTNVMEIRSCAKSNGKSPPRGIGKGLKISATGRKAEKT